MSALAGRIALVVGAGRGIGRAIAEAYAREGAALVLAARTRAHLDAAAEEARQLGAPAVRVLPLDVADTAAIREAVTDIANTEKRLDVLVVSSGIYGPIAPLGELDIDAWVHALRVDLVGPLALLNAALPLMTRQGGGKVIILGGGGATQPMAAFSAYAAAKAGLVRLAESAALEVRDRNVQINVIAPGLVDTGLQDDVLAAGDAAGALGENIRAARETGRGAVGAELAAELAVFLGSPLSGNLTGKLIAAPYDPWRSWRNAARDSHDLARIAAITDSDWFTLRRLDPHTIGQLPEGLV